MSALKNKLKVAFADHLEVAKDEKEDWYEEVAQIEDFEYEMDIQTFFKLIPELKIGAIAHNAGINASHLRQYAKGTARASEKRARLFGDIVHELGRELIAVRFCFFGSSLA